MPKGYDNLEQIATIDFLKWTVTIKLENACSKLSEEIIIFTIKNIEYINKISVNY
jgi:hypothetical protein